MHQPRPSTLFSPIFSLAREKIGPPEARQKRPRRNESLQARLLILCARFFLSKPQTEFAVWVFFMQICNNLSVSAAPSQHPYPFCPFGTFPPDRGNRPLEGEPFLLLLHQVILIQQLRRGLAGDRLLPAEVPFSVALN